MNIRNTFSGTIFVLMLLAASLLVSAGGGPSLPNGDFETGLSNWTLSNKAGDKLVCQGDNKHNDYEGLCGFLFKGNADSRAVLKNSASDTFVNTVNAATESSNLALEFDLFRYSESALTKLTFKAIAVLDDDTRIVGKHVSTGVTVGMRMTRASWIIVHGDPVVIPQGSTMTKFKIKILDKSNAGKQWIDMVDVGID
jgi:hypothetical protein